MNETQLNELRCVAEAGLVSICFVDPASIDSLATMVSPTDFADTDLGDVFRIVADLRDAGYKIEPRAVLVEAKQRGVFRHLTTGYILRLINAGYAPSNAEHYALTVARLARNRRLMAAARSLLAREYDATAEPADLLNRFEAATHGLLSGHDGGFVSFADAISETITEHRSAIETGATIGFSTGFPSLDGIIGGFYPGQLVLLGGRTFAGKTALALTFASYSATRGRPTWFVSLEMSRRELAERILADDCGFELRQFTQAGLTADALQTIEKGIGLQAWANSLDEDLRERLVRVGLVEPRLRITLSKFCASFKATRSNVAAATRLRDAQVCELLIERFGPEVLLESISVRDAEEWRCWLATLGNKRDKERVTLSDNTVRRRTGVARQIFATAIRWGYITVNPFAGMATTVRENLERRAFVSWSDVVKIIAEAPSTEWKALIAFVRLTGCRVPSELQGLTWADIDFAGRNILIRAPKTAHHGGDMRFGQYHCFPSCCRIWNRGAIWWDLVSTYLSRRLFSQWLAIRKLTCALTSRA